MWLSVIIPTRNRLLSLQNLLESFERATASKDWDVEILVVDNGSTDGTAVFLRREIGKPRKFALKILHEKTPGKANALNTGLSKARGDIIIIIDDDVTAHPALFCGHLEEHQSTGFHAIQGRILAGKDPQGDSADPAKLREYNIPYIDYGDQVREIRGLTGTNMSFQRQVFEKVGFFDTRLGPGAAGFSEDSEYSLRIRKAGFKIGYIPHAIVYHELNPNRYGREYNRMVEYRKGLSRSLYRRDSVVFNVVPNLVANIIRYGLYRLMGKTQKAYKTEGRIMKCWGYLIGKARGVNSADHRSQI
jgi:glycosyltransferase involved in cell wall biosynthesis